MRAYAAAVADPRVYAAPGSAARAYAAGIAWLWRLGGPVGERLPRAVGFGAAEEADDLAADVGAGRLAGAVVLGTVGCAALGLCLAGTLRALATLAAANGLYLVLLLLSGMVIPVDELPSAARAVARALPSGALAEAVRGSLTAGVDIPGRAWLVLAAWAVAAPLAATRLFRWE